MAAATACIYKTVSIYMLFLATFPILYVWEAAAAFFGHLFLSSMFGKQQLFFCQLSSPLSFANNEIVQLQKIPRI
jgi:hypothetical protein